MPFPSLSVDFPSWVGDLVDPDKIYQSDEARMGLAVQLARENVVRQTGGPFGAAVFKSAGGRLVAVGINLVFRFHNCVLHAETVALMAAQKRLSSFTLAAPGIPPCELVTSCEPCAMCLGATLWSGVKRLVCGAAREDAHALGFDEGPVFPESFTYLQERGIVIARDVLREEARSVLELYGEMGGPIYYPWRSGGASGRSG